MVGASLSGWENNPHQELGVLQVTRKHDGYSNGFFVAMNRGAARHYSVVS